MHAFDFILVRFSFVFECRDLVASRGRQHIVFGRRRLKLIGRRDEQDRVTAPAIESTCVAAKEDGRNLRRIPAACYLELDQAALACCKPCTSAAVRVFPPTA